MFAISFVWLLLYAVTGRLQACEISPDNPLRDLEGLIPETDAKLGFDLTVLRENLKLTPWERLLANDDMVNFCDSARSVLLSSGCNGSVT